MNIDGLPELTLLHQPNGDLASAYEQIHALDGPGIFKSPDGDGLIVTAYDALQTLRKSPDLQALKRDLRVGGAGEIGALAQVASYTPFFVDEPMHAPLAAATYKALGPSRKEPITERFASCVMDTLQRMRPQESCNLVEEFARTVTRKFWMRELGAPDSMDQKFSGWSMAIVPMLAFECSAEQVAAANQATREMWDFLLDLERTTDEESMLTRLARDVTQIDHSVKRDPICGADVAAAITFDGIDSAAGAITNFLYLVLLDDALQAFLREQPEQIDAAMQEAMRLETPLPVLQRGTTAPITYESVEIPKGINIHMAWGCGSRDPSAYAEPNAFKLNRKNRTLLAFGGGKRFCKGRTLAMLQCTLAMDLLLANTKWIELTGTPKWSPPGSLRTVDALHCLIRYME